MVMGSCEACDPSVGTGAPGAGGGQNGGNPVSVASKERLDPGTEATDKDGFTGT